MEHHCITAIGTTITSADSPTKRYCCYPAQLPQNLCSTLKRLEVQGTGQRRCGADTLQAHLSNGVRKNKDYHLSAFIHVHWDADVCEAGAVVVAAESPCLGGSELLQIFYWRFQWLIMATVMSFECDKAILTSIHGSSSARVLAGSPAAADVGWHTRRWLDQMCPLRESAGFVQQCLFQ